MWSRWTWEARHSTRSPQKVSHIRLTAASRRRFASRGTTLWSSRSSSETSRITSHQASPSCAAATIAWSIASDIRSSTPEVNSSPSRPGSADVRPSQSAPGTIRFAISTRPSASTTRSSALPDQPRDASTVCSAISPRPPTRAGSKAGRPPAPATPVRCGAAYASMAGHAAVARQQVVPLAHGRAVAGDPLQPDRGAGVMDVRGPLDEPAGPGEERLQASHDRGRALETLAPAADVEVELRVVGVALAQRAEVAGLQTGPQGVGGAHGRRPEPTFATAGSS